ncbi:MAG TPA: TetR/AcrR family transcriptional regulator [Symbiobacteriaceae bacterium]|nr:TetR/AcrR family transcriptional regulator [Symbiobacteriaceae bacterium]
MSPRSEEENQRIRDERREQILMAAAKVFARKGLAATKIAEVAALAGASHGLVYHYFPSKEELFAALIERALFGATFVSQGALAQPGSPLDQLRWMLTLMLGGVLQQPDFFLVMVQAVTSDAVPRATRDLAIHQGAVSQAAVTQLIAAGQAAGQITAGDPEQLAIVLLAMINGLAIGVSADPTLMAKYPDAEVLLKLLKP